MLSKQEASRRSPSSTGSGKRTRVFQRRLHVIVGLAIVVYVYAGPAAHAPLTLAVRWLLLPLLAISGVAMWQWPKIRQLTRQRARR